MNYPTRAVSACLAVACVAYAATPARLKQQLTTSRIAELSGPGSAAEIARYTVQIDGLEVPGPVSFEKAAAAPRRSPAGPARVSFPAGTPGMIEAIRECRYPSDFDPHRRRRTRATPSPR